MPTTSMYRESTQLKEKEIRSTPSEIPAAIAERQEALIVCYK